MKKIIISIALLLNSYALLSQDTTLLRWAADAESGAPYVFQDPRIPTKLIGFEVDIINAISKEMGVENKHFQNQWDGLVPGLKRNDYDIAINGIEITEDRKKEVAFSIPYYITFQQIVVRADSKDIEDLNGLENKKVGTLKASLAERILNEHGKIKVKTYDSEVNSYEDLKNGRLDAVLIDEPVAKYYAGWNPALKLTGEPIGEVVYGIAMRKQDTVLQKRINTALTKLITTGKLREILERWDMWNYMVALYLDDKSVSKIKPDKYDAFIKSQKTDLSFDDYVDRYIGYLPILGHAAITTIVLSVISMILAIVLGLVLALTRVYSPRPFSFLATTYIEVIRGTPLLIQLFFIYYALPSLGINMDPFSAAVLGLGLNYAAYEAENYRAGLYSVPKGQMEAAVSLGMSRRQSLRHIIIPQAIRLVIPPVTNDFISLLKDTSLVSVIAMAELTKRYLELSATYYDYIGTGIIVAVIYLIIGLPFVKLSKYLEKKYSLEGSTKTI
ncbi:transporter substrate-binding domain-containing protein [bacterium]|nr:MAG: transporter substrate-binding domain-containing protein [bacterium]